MTIRNSPLLAMSAGCIAGEQQILCFHFFALARFFDFRIQPMAMKTCSQFFSLCSLHLYFVFSWQVEWRRPQFGPWNTSRYSVHG